MLVLTRKCGEGIIIGDDVKITVVDVRGGSIRIGIDAPRSKKIHRLEVYERIKTENRKATQWQPTDLQELTRKLDTTRKQPRP
ncbi:carbon storage regulator [Geothermobacter hydrogeniphilus]|uniref:Translational regulator CsrA n=1 Tax=Geothermobacter hydrogeniphilus TaxID=1969733 RepID=A0A1X0YEG8_9BACT|nr:carbon storage regulator CsrA [Geothermobacter hydrogeniphilus]ORJ63492.1 carbon storage regulator [Geothermobacter hydrogeniphilus]PNU21150.1 carbon storage regulator [Geothermobacter hydrogeniphilus]